MRVNLAPPVQRRAAIDAAWSPWQSRSLGALFVTVASRHPDRPFVLGEEKSLTYAALEAASASMAAGLIARGVKPGDRVALLMANHPEFVVARLAIARAGAVAVPLNFLLGYDELAYIVVQSGAVALIAMADFRGRDYRPDIAQLAALPGVSTVAVLGDAGQAGMLSVAELMAGRSDLLPEVDPTSLSDVIYTSGTTGRPKGVMLTHDMVTRTGFACARVRALPDASRLLFVSPLYHVHGYVECMVAALYVGGAIVPQTRFDPAAMLDLAERHAATEISGVPTMTSRLLETAAERGFDDAALGCVFNTGGMNQPGIWAEIRHVLRPNEVVTAYGMTETTASTVCTLPEGPDERLADTNGVPKQAGPAAGGATGCVIARYRLRDPIDGVGELEVTGPQVTSGYFGKPAETEAAFSGDGWLRTGDLGRIDPEGYVTLIGRLKEAYRCGGEMVMPREVETVLEEHPNVAQAFVVGVPDPRMEEVGCACIVRVDGAMIDEKALIAHCVPRLARFKVPRHVLVMAAEDIPLTATGRPQKFKLVALAVERLAEMREAELARAG